MSEEDLFDDIIDDAVDEFLTPTLRPNEDSPGVPSGVSSHSGSGPSTASSAVPARSKAKPKSSGIILPCTYSGCKKSYKTQKGFDNHIFTHKITDINLRKPSFENLMEAADGLVCTILQEILKESFSSEVKRKLVQDILEKRSVLVSEWAVVVHLLSKPILEILTKRTKLLPHNQYEEFLSQFNALLNQEGYVSSVRDQLRKIVPVHNDNLRLVRLIIFQLSTRLGDEFQLSIIKELRQRAPVQMIPKESTPLTPVEKKIFDDKIGTIVRTYFSKAIMISNEVWNTRCECLRLRFMVFLDDTRKSDIVKKSLWIEGKISASENIIDFCEGLESIIKNFMSSSKEPVSPDKVIESLLESDNVLITTWHTLTTGYFSELDSLIFMRDFVSIFINLSVRLEEARLQRVEGEQRLQQFATRDNLKRN